MLHSTDRFTMNKGMQKTGMKANSTNPDLAAWKRQAGEVSLPEVHRSIFVPGKAPYWRKMWAFAGPGFLVAVGYMDPGAVRLYAAGRHPDFQSDGDPAPTPLR